MMLEMLRSADTIEQIGYVFVALVLLAAIFAIAARHERRSLLAVTGLLALTVTGIGISGMLLRWGWREPAEYLRWFATLGAGMCLISLSGVTLFRVVLPALRLSTPRILQDLVVGLAYAGWGFVWLRANDVDLTSIVATSAVITAVIGFSLQDTLGNILGGVAIELDQSIELGDWIKVDDLVGRVVEIRWRRTTLETRNWETVVIPNSQLVKNKFLVLGRRQGQPVEWRRWIWFNVDFRYAPTLVINTVESAIRAADIPNMAKAPQPNCVLMEFADSYCRYALRYWLTDLGQDDGTDSQVRTHLYFALRRVDVPLSMPAQAVFVTEDNEERKAIKNEQSLSHRVDVLLHVDIFKALTQDELKRLAEHLIAAPFVRGDVMTRQGSTAHWLYIVLDGQADVVVQNDQGQTRKVAELGPGSFFGEMGLLTGAPRRATVLARTDVDCYRLDQEAFKEILKSRPTAAEEISGLLARRQMELEAAREDLDAEVSAQRLSETRGDILESIIRFFGLES